MLIPFSVLHHDDDVIVPLQDLEAAFSIWLRNKDRFLGFEPRVIACDETKHKSSGKTGQHECQYRFKLTQGYFDLIIGKLMLGKVEGGICVLRRYADIVDSTSRLHAAIHGGPGAHAAVQSSTLRRRKSQISSWIPFAYLTRAIHRLE